MAPSIFCGLSSIHATEKPKPNFFICLLIDLLIILHISVLKYLAHNILQLCNSYNLPVVFLNVSQEVIREHINKLFLSQQFFLLPSPETEAPPAESVLGADHPPHHLLRPPANCKLAKPEQ